MLVTKIDISAERERKYTTAPVSITDTTPSASGSAAAASEPKTSSSTISTIGSPMNSACSRSCLESSCMPAQSAPWPTRCTGTDASSWSSMPRLSRIWAASSTAWSRPAVTVERHDHDRLVLLALRLQVGGVVELDAVDVLERLAAHLGQRDAELARAHLAVVEDDRERLGLRARDVLERLGGELGPRALVVEPASGEVLGLLGGEREREDQETDPDAEHETPATRDEALEPVHGGLHVRVVHPSWPFGLAILAERPVQHRSDRRR